MSTIWRFASIIGVLLSISVSASAQPLSIPPWREGQHVYVVPEGWDAPLFGPNDFREMDAELSKLHYPFYVVIASELNGSDEDTVALQATDAIAQRWAETGNGYDVGKSQIFVLSFEPRKYSFLAGKTFTTTAGINPDEFIATNRIFENAMHGTPKDPKGGIIALAQAVDVMLVDRTDPIKIAQRAEAERQAAIARAEARRAEQARERLTAARGALDASILQLTQLLDSPKATLPADTSSYHDLLVKAKQVRAKDDPGEMDSFAAGMRPSIATLRTHVDTAALAIAQARRKQALEYGGLLAGIAGILTFLFLRRRSFLARRRTFNDAVTKMETMVTNASSRYVGFNDSRDAIKALGEQHGRTKELFDTVSAEVDAIFGSVCAMKTNIGRCKLEAAKAGFFNFGPLTSAQAKLTGTFTIETDEMDEATLFGSETKTITVDVEKFTGDLETRFKACINGWNRLKEATEQVGKTAKELFPHVNLDALMAMADANGIPRRWLHDHPLYGDDAADEAMYADLDARNQSDPVAFSEGIAGLNAKEVEVTERLHRLMDTLKSVTTLRSGTEPSTYGVIVDPGDDPTSTFESARREDAAFMTLLSTCETEKELDDQAAKTVLLYREVHAQNIAIKTALDTIAADLEVMKAACASAGQEQTAAQQRSLAAQKVHSNLNVARSFTQGQAAFKDAQTAMSAASMANSARRFLTASRRAKESLASAKSARQGFADVMAACDAADAKRAEYLNAVSRMASQRDSAAAVIMGYGYSANLTTFSAPRISGAADYGVLMTSLVATRESWALAQRKATEAYQAEQRRKREAEERARREREAQAQRQRDAEARRRRAAESASRGSSFGGGGTSSRGGGFGGGGSSSRGGSW